MRGPSVFPMRWVGMAAEAISVLPTVSAVGYH
jgi:hypothetical protein